MKKKNAYYKTVLQLLSAHYSPWRGNDLGKYFAAYNNVIAPRGAICVYSFFVHGPEFYQLILSIYS
jgi:hypothetical protein